MKISITLIIFIFLSVFLTMCKKKEDNNNNPVIPQKYDIIGKAQKGPFVTGSNITISELDSNLNPTGKNFYTTIMNNEGYFELPNVELVSNYVQLKVEGNHFNEYHGIAFNNNSITLYCIVDLAQAISTNINLLTHLEKDRLVKYKHDGLSFSEAKNLAQKEVLKIFNLDNINIQNSEALDISSALNNNAVLLAVSLIIQGSRDGSQLVEFLTNIRDDLNDNGILNSIDIQKRLISQAKFVYSPDIIKNLKNFYGSNYVVPPFINYIDTFIVNSLFTSSTNYIFPELSQQGINLLYFDQDTSILNILNTYSLLFKTDVNSKINMSTQLIKMSGNGGWNTNYNLNWTLNDHTDVSVRPRASCLTELQKLFL